MSSEKKYVVHCKHSDGNTIQHAPTDWLTVAPVACPDLDGDHTFITTYPVQFRSAPVDNHFCLLRYAWDDAGDSVVVGAADTYYKLDQYTTVKVNGITYVDGDVTVNAAGYYHLETTMTWNADADNQEVAFGLHAGGVLANEIRTTLGTNKSIVHFGMIAYLPAGTVLDLRVANKTSDADLTIYGAQVTVDLRIV